MEGKKGAVHIDIPKCVASSKVPESLYTIIKNKEAKISKIKLK